MAKLPIDLMQLVEEHEERKQYVKEVIKAVVVFTFIVLIQFI